MVMKLNMVKEGESGPKLKLNLKKPKKFTLELYWDDGSDLDAHVLLATNSGNGAKVSDLGQVLSTFNESLPLADGSAGSRRSGDKRPFMTPCGSLCHSGDARSGVGVNIDEIVTVDGARLPAGVNELPIFVTLYPAAGKSFGEVAKAGIRIKDEGGNVLGEYELSTQFASFNAVQMGSLMLESGEWVYHAAGSGFNGDFEAVLTYFS